MSINISYIIATQNRLPYLKITLEKLMNELLADEEIIVINGNSNDGTSGYLEQLYLDKKIQFYINEPDKNQAHAWNKGFLLANGKFIKKIMDDDIFCFSAIRKCKEWMTKNPEIDICISDTLQTNLEKPHQVSKTSRLAYFSNWQKGKTKCFSFSDVYMLIRKDVLSFTGLYDTSFRMIDWEFSLRCSFLQTKIAYYTGYNSLTVHTPGNVTSLSSKETFKNEARIAKVKYNYPGDEKEISLWSKLKIFIGERLHKVQKEGHLSSLNEKELAIIYHQFYTILEQENRNGSFNFIC